MKEEDRVHCCLSRLVQAVEQCGALWVVERLLLVHVLALVREDLNRQPLSKATESGRDAGTVLWDLMSGLLGDLREQSDVSALVE